MYEYTEDEIKRQNYVRSLVEKHTQEQGNPMPQRVLLSTVQTNMAADEKVPFQPFTIFKELAEAIGDLIFLGVLNPTAQGLSIVNPEMNQKS